MAIEAYLMDYDTREQIDIQSFEPPSEAIPINDADQDIHGLSLPYRFYLSTGFDSWTIALKLAVSLFQADDGRIWQLKDAVNFVKSFAYPDYGKSSGGVRYESPPHMAFLKLGGLLEGKGFLKDPTFQYGSTYYENDRDGEAYPHVVEVSFTFDRFFDEPPDYFDIRSGWV